MSSVLIEGKIKKLTKKEENFCQEYLLDFNATRAAKASGYSEDSATSIGSENLRKPHIQIRIAELRKDSAEKLTITKERILREYARLAFADIRKAFDEDGKLKNIADLDDETAAVIAGIESDELYEWAEDGSKKVNTGITRKVKLWNKADGLSGLSKILGYNAPEKIDATVVTSGVVKIGGKKLDNE